MAHLYRPPIYSSMIPMPTPAAPTPAIHQPIYAIERMGAWDPAIDALYPPACMATAILVNRWLDQHPSVSEQRIDAADLFGLGSLWADLIDEVTPWAIEDWGRALDWATGREPLHPGRPPSPALWEEWGQPRLAWLTGLPLVPVAPVRLWWCHKAALAGGRAVGLAIRIPPTWGDDSVRGRHHYPELVPVSPRRDATCIVLYGWDDTTDECLFEYCDIPHPPQSYVGRLNRSYLSMPGTVLESMSIVHIDTLTGV